MLMFSLGTVPLMLGLGSMVSILGRKFTAQVMKAGAILVVVLGLTLLTQGAALAGIMPVMGTGSTGMVPEELTKNELTEEAGETTAADKAETADEEDSKAADGIQVINSELTRGRYPEITVKAGVPVHWVIDAPAENINGCNGVMVIPDYGIEHSFEPGENVIEFTPKEAGVYGYSCWMGMVYGSINVIE